MEDFYAQLEAAFFADADTICREVIALRPSPEKSMRLVEEIFQLTDGFLDQFQAYSKKQQNMPECHKGCAWCCYQSVLVYPYEVAYMVFKLYETKGKDWFFQTIFPKAVAKDEKYAGIKIPGFIHKKHACPFLEKDSCLAYDFRPIACRTFLSASAKACAVEYAHPEDYTNYPPIYDLPLRIGRVINTAVTGYLNSLGIETHQWRMEWFVRKLVEEPTIYNQYIHGKKPFTERHVDDDEWRYLENNHKA